MHPCKSFQLWQNNIFQRKFILLDVLIGSNHLTSILSSFSYGYSAVK